MLQVVNKKTQSLQLTFIRFHTCFRVSVVDFEHLFPGQAVSRILRIATVILYLFSQQINTAKQSQQRKPLKWQKIIQMKTYSDASSCNFYFKSSQLVNIFKSNHRRCSIKKVFLNNSQNSQENTCAKVLFLIKFLY